MAAVLLRFDFHMLRISFGARFVSEKDWFGQPK